VPPPAEQEAASRLEEELKDARAWYEFLAPRPVRMALEAAGALSCTVGAALDLARLASDAPLAAADGTAGALGVNAAGAALFAAALRAEQAQAEARVVSRAQKVAAQRARGQRETVPMPGGGVKERLKQVDDRWILSRLERWGRQDGLPMVGPVKGALLQQLVQEERPGVVYEVGTFLGYSAITMAQAVEEGALVYTAEKDWRFVLAARRFCWQSNQGERAPGEPRVGERVRVRWGDARDLLRRHAAEGGPQIDMLFLDGDPKEYLDYLKAAEPALSPGALVVADNAVVFERSLEGYLDYVRGSGRYQSSTIETTFEWRDDVPDGIEVSRLL